MAPGPNHQWIDWLIDWLIDKHLKTIWSNETRWNTNPWTTNEDHYEVMENNALRKAWNPSLIRRPPTGSETTLHSSVPTCIFFRVAPDWHLTRPTSGRLFKLQTTQKSLTGACHLLNNLSFCWRWESVEHTCKPWTWSILFEHFEKTSMLLPGRTIPTYTQNITFLVMVGCVFISKVSEKETWWQHVRDLTPPNSAARVQGWESVCWGLLGIPLLEKF